jgi:hypothetical protein
VRTRSPARRQAAADTPRRSAHGARGHDACGAQSR